MRLLSATIAVIASLLAGSGVCAELTMGPKRGKLPPRSVPAQHGRFSGSVSDPLGRPGSDIVAKESTFTKASRALPPNAAFGGALRGTISDFAPPSGPDHPSTTSDRER